MARTKTNTRNNAKHVKHQDATDILKKKTILCFSDFSGVFLFVSYIMSYMISTRNVKLPGT